MNAWSGSGYIMCATVYMEKAASIFVVVVLSSMLAMVVVVIIRLRWDEK